MGSASLCDALFRYAVMCICNFAGIQPPSLSYLAVSLMIFSLSSSLDSTIISHAVVKAQAQATAVEHTTEEEEAVPKVESPVVVITSASTGIGKAIALSLGKAGCKV